MRRATQGLLLAFFGVVLLRLGMGDEYLRFVSAWMRWPILASGALLLLLALQPMLDRTRDDDDPHGVPLSTWLLLLPGLVVFTVSPPALGAYLAERRAGDSPPPPPVSTFSPLPAGEDVPVEIDEFTWRAELDDGATLRERTVELHGFVSNGPGDTWYVTRMAIACCAADAAAYRVRVDGAERPPRDQWVKVAGTWVEGTGTAPGEVPAIAATRVEHTKAPRQTYR